MTPHLIEIVLLMLAFFLLGCLIGYYLRRWTTGNETASEPAPNVTPPNREAEKSATNENAPSSAPVTSSASESVVEKTAPAAKPKSPAKKPAQKAPAKKAEAKTSAKKTAAKAPAPKKAEDAPELLSAPRDGKKDDLKKIKGIGPKIETILNEKGIYHFDQIASWKRKDVNTMDEALSFKGRIDREEWVKQAKALAKADTA
ncbi:hypothetical protein [Maritalea mediterranea]|uniref:Flap endonuclease-1-like 5' DNA nuclease n=1 Tax=Maritalea mediterranea TaxID=2909667 RepID=A0ABS9E5K5_9HYPH|nr:hypothetical protein [Maritalea mediterranea]MCF4098153.1 hypothetical protein [Maritalea mediterranea]